MSDEPKNETNTWLARYTFIGVIGEGGMGQVYLAEDIQNDNRQVVVKQTKIGESGDQEHLLKIFYREAEMLRRLNHRGIVKLVDDFWSKDTPEFMFLVMEYVPGENLEKIVNLEGPLTSETVIKIAIQCCDVLEYLHSQSPPIIYRDLKPSNLILRPDGLVVFVDFGIARDFEPKGPSTRVVTSGYAPPEQYFGKPEPRGDIYSLGATMHQLLTGVRPRPLTQCSPGNILAGVLKDLDNLVHQMTEHDIDKRPPSARAVQFELFRMYKMYHPEFEIPDLGIDDDVELDDARSRNQNGRSAASAEHSRNRGAKQSLRSIEEDDDEPATRPTLLDRFRQWVYDLRSRL